MTVRVVCAACVMVVWVCVTCIAAAQTSFPVVSGPSASRHQRVAAFDVDTSPRERVDGAQWAKARGVKAGAFRALGMRSEQCTSVRLGSRLEEALLCTEPEHRERSYRGKYASRISTRVRVIVARGARLVVALSRTFAFDVVYVEPGMDDGNILKLRVDVSTDGRLRIAEAQDGDCAKAARQDPSDRAAAHWYRLDSALAREACSSRGVYTLQGQRMVRRR